MIRITLDYERVSMDDPTLPFAGEHVKAIERTDTAPHPIPLPFPWGEGA